jgi:hypothetical protein
MDGIQLFSSKTGLANTFFFFIRLLCPSRPDTRGRLMLHFLLGRGFFSGSPTAGRVSGPSGPRIPQQASIQSTYSTVVPHWYMYDILAPLGNSFR